METLKAYGGLTFNIVLPPPHQPIEDVSPPQQIILPLSERPGLYCRSLVEIGETVLKGERIGEDPTGKMMPIHSPISGKIADIRNYRFAMGGNTRSIFMESDEKDEPKPPLTDSRDFMEADPLELIRVIRDLGVKVIPYETLPDAERAGTAITPVKHFILNAIGHGFAGSIVRRLLVEKPEEILLGIRLIKKVFQPEGVFLVINKQHDDAIQTVQDSGIGKEADIRPMEVYYPLGHPHLLFKAFFKKEIPTPGGKAIDFGVAFVSLDTLIHAVEAVRDGKPHIERYITVSGAGIKEPKNLKVRIGTPLSDVIEHCGGFNGAPGRIVLGNPLDGMAQFTLDRPVLNDTRWLWVQPQEMIIHEKYRACINCGDCVDICPVRIMPNMLGRYCEFCKYEEAASQYDLYTCIECGLCAHVCPTRRPLVHFIRFGKWELSLKERENANE